MRKNQCVVVFAALLACIAGCAHVPGMVIREIEGLSMELDDDGKVTMKVTVPVNNNTLSGKLEQATYEVQAAGMFLGKSISELRIDLAPQTVFNVECSFSLKLNKMSGAFLEALATRKVPMVIDLKLDIQGEDEPVTMRIERIVPVTSLPTTSFKGKLDGQLFRLKDARFSNVDLTKTVMTLHVEMRNPLPLDLDLRGIQYEVKLNGQPLGSGRVEKDLTLEPEKSTPIDLPLEIPHSNMPRAILLTLQGTGRKLTVEGSAIVKPFFGIEQISFSLEGDDSTFRALPKPGLLIPGLIPQ